MKAARTAKRCALLRELINQRVMRPARPLRVDEQVVKRLRCLSSSRRRASGTLDDTIQSAYVVMTTFQNVSG